MKNSFSDVSASELKQNPYEEIQVSGGRNKSCKTFARRNHASDTLIVTDFNSSGRIERTMKSGDEYAGSDL